jgi:hypothetical protein
MTTTPKTFVFAVMPFRAEFDDMYQLGIKGACEAAGAYCERVDEQMYEGMVIERIYNQINKADLIVAELSARSPNVLYETGYAHGLGKRLILIGRSEDDIPLDLNQHAHVIYGDSVSVLKSELTKRLRWAMENPEENPSKAELFIEFYVGGKPLSSTDSVEMPLLGTNGAVEGFVFRLDIHNRTDRPFSRRLGLAVVTEDIGRNESEAKVVTLPDKRFLHLLEREVTVPPGAWDNVEWVLRDRTQYYSPPVEFDIEVVAYADFGSVRSPLRVKPAFTS